MTVLQATIRLYQNNHKFKSKRQGILLRTTCRFNKNDKAFSRIYKHLIIT